MNENVPFVWRKNYRNEAASPGKVLENAHEKARQYLSRAAEINESSDALSPSDRTRFMPEVVRKEGNTMYIQIVSLVAQAIKALLERSEEPVIIAHFTGCRWCDSTERELNDHLIGGRSWFGNRFEVRHD